MNVPVNAPGQGAAGNGAARSGGLVAGAIVAALITLLIAAIGGGWIALGRVDPLLALPGLGWALGLAALVSRSRGWRVPLVSALAATAAALLPALIIARHWRWMEAALLLIAALVAAAVALLLVGAVRRRITGRWRWAVMALALVAFGLAGQGVGWRLVPQLYRAPPAVPALRVTLLSALPLVTSGTADDGRLRAERHRAPIVDELARSTHLTIADALDPALLAQTDVLLLAHPRTLPPETLVLVDGWVRQGGAALILADGLSVWPARFPVGDPRNPPITSMLGPLLDHWGLQLDAPPGLRVTDRRIAIGAHHIVLRAPGQWVDRGSGCVISASASVARCRIGQGPVLLVADADLLNAALWLGAAARGPASARADTPLWLVDELFRLAGRRAPTPVASPVWVR